MVTKNDTSKLIKQAKRALRNSYAPYSRYKVGAALLTNGGKIFTGCNIENSSFGATACAERVALYKAFSEGERKIKTLAIVAGGSKKPVPCGICRQVIWELAGDVEIIISHRGKVEILRLLEIYPKPF